MKFDFPIKNIKFEFECYGSAKVNLHCNGKQYPDNEVRDLQDTNKFIIEFTKDDPADEKSFARLTGVLINGFGFTDDFKNIAHEVDQKLHKDCPKMIANNLYFGYIGRTKFSLTHKNDALTNAAWVLANNEFEHVKFPLKGDNYREKNLHNILRDTKYMFVGSLAPQCQDIIDSINGLALQDLRLPLKPNDRTLIENWINRSSRINLSNFDKMEHFTYTNGIVDCLNSFITDTESLYLPSKVYYFYRELLGDKNVTIKDLQNDPIEENSKVLLELPAPWYETKDLMQKIKEAKSKNCLIALDLTWLPISRDNIDLDLQDVDQIFFSMNKTWPIQDFRPAFRWSKTRINDAQTFQWDHCTYPKISANVFMHLIQQFELDYVFDKYRPLAVEIMRHFDLEPTSVLWFTLHDNVKHDIKNPIWPYYYLDDFVCLRKLFDFKGKYFW